MWVKTENGEVLNTLQHASKCNPYLLYDTVKLPTLLHGQQNTKRARTKPHTLPYSFSDYSEQAVRQNAHFCRSSFGVVFSSKTYWLYVYYCISERESHGSHKSSTVQHHRQWSTLITAMPEERTKWSSNYSRYCNKSWVKVWISTVYNYRVIQYRVNASRIL